MTATAATTIWGYPVVKNMRHYREDDLFKQAAEGSCEIHHIQIPFQEKGKGRHQFIFTTVYWNKERPVKGDVLILHGIDGFGSFFSRYSSKEFLENGYRVTVPDLPGHGRTALLNPGSHGLYDDFSVFSDTAELCLKNLIPRFEQSESGKVFLMGKSLGGMHVINYLDAYEGKHNVDAALFICPAVKLSPHSKPSWLLEQTVRTVLYLMPFLSNWEAPSEGVKGNISSDPSIEEEFYADPWNYRGRVKMGTGKAVLTSFATMPEKIAKISLPFLILHGDADRACNVEGSRELLSNSKTTSKLKELIVYEGIEHIIFAEKPEAMLDLIRFLDKRIALGTDQEIVKDGTIAKEGSSVTLNSNSSSHL